MKRISFEEYNQWSEDVGGLISQDGFFDDEDIFEEEGVHFHDGNLSVDSLHVAPCTVVNGDLVVTGDITYEFDRGLLVVNGNLRCKDFTFPFPTVITGNLYASNVRVDSGCDYYLIVAGNVYAESLIEDGHYIQVLGEVVAPEVKSFLNELTIGGKVVSRSSRE